MTHIIDKLATEHETLSKITAHLANGEDAQARAELSEMVWRLAEVADSLQPHSLEYSFENNHAPYSKLDFKISHSVYDYAAFVGVFDNVGQVVY